MARVVGWRTGHFNTQELANTAWAFAMVSQSDAQLFTRLARAAEQRVFNFDAQELANAAWAFAMVSRSDVALFRAVARAAEQQSDLDTTKNSKKYQK